MSFRKTALLIVTVIGLVILSVPLFVQKSNAFERVTGHARVVDGDTIAVNGQKVRLHGIDAPEKAQKCAAAHGLSWACGRASKRFLQSMIGRQKVSCKLHKKDGYGRWIGTCFLKRTNLNKKMVRSGMAWAFRKYSRDFVREEKQAERKKLGIWKVKSQPAWEYRKAKWKSAAVQPAPGNCKIKGNISRRHRRIQKIYHLPGFRSYGKTRINLKKGERWFCTEREATKAGWRRAHNVH